MGNDRVASPTVSYQVCHMGVSTLAERYLFWLNGVEDFALDWVLCRPVHAISWSLVMPAQAQNECRMSDYFSIYASPSTYADTSCTLSPWTTIYTLSMMTQRSVKIWKTVHALVANETHSTKSMAFYFSWHRLLAMTLQWRFTRSLRGQILQRSHHAYFACKGQFIRINTPFLSVNLHQTQFRRWDTRGKQKLVMRQALFWI